ncbi:MAG: YchJ family protein [Treponema sp.]|nr:YchJ family protein [Treponema sp.]
MSEVAKTDQCPCGASKTYGDCCAPILADSALALTAEALMRARYSAYVVGAIDFIINTCTQDDGTRTIDRKATEDWSKNATWHGLRILRTERGGKQDTEGTVEFEADYTLHHLRDRHHETASFKKVDGRWLYETGRLKTTTVVRDGKKIGRNELCPCGSGKKYKNCCGKNA